MYSFITSTTPVLVSDAPLLAPMIRNRVCAGFPSPAEDLGAQQIDLTQLLVAHAQATYFLRARGLSMIELGIFDNDILVVDRAINPRHNHIVVAVVDGDRALDLLYMAMHSKRLLKGGTPMPISATRR